MLLISLIALAFVIAGVVCLVRYSTWAGVALIAVGVLIYLLRHSIDTSGNAAVMSLVVVPLRKAKLGIIP